MEVKPDRKMKCIFSKQRSYRYCCMDTLYKQREKAWRQLHKNAASNIEQVQEAAPHKVADVQPLTTHDENYPS